MPEETIITPQENGPYYVKGNFRVVLSDGTELAADGETWLCRCGQSKMKPFCDSSHKKAGFVCDNMAMKAAAD